MAESDDVAALHRAVRRLERRYGMFCLQLDWSLAFVLCAQLQLALRHPDNVSAAATEARKIVEGIIESIEKSEPAAAAILRRADTPDDLRDPLV